MKCTHCSAEMDMSVPMRNAEAYGGRTFVVACTACGLATSATIGVVVKVIHSSKYTGDHREDDWGHPIKRLQKVS